MGGEAIGEDAEGTLLAQGLSLANPERWQRWGAPMRPGIQTRAAGTQRITLADVGEAARRPWGWCSRQAPAWRTLSTRRVGVLSGVRGSRRAAGVGEAVSGPMVVSSRHYVR